MVNIRHGQLEKGGEAHVATLNCAALVAELGEEHAGQDGVQTLRHVEGGGASQLVFRPNHRRAPSWPSGADLRQGLTVEMLSFEDHVFFSPAKNWKSLDSTMM